MLFILAVLLAASPEAVHLRYRAMVEDWARSVRFTRAEQDAMQSGRRWEALMMKGPDDPLAQKILAAGEPGFESVARWYPGKLLDRTVLGSRSDPTRPPGPSDDEFVIWWNGAISTGLIRGPMTDRYGATGVRPVAHELTVLFRVGKAGEIYGTDRASFTPPGYEDGYLPIVVSSYRRDGIDYRQTAFAAQAPAETAFVALEAVNLTGAPKDAVVAAETVMMEGSGTRKREDLRLPPHGRARRFWKISRDALHPGTAAEFDRYYAATRAGWLKLLAGAAKVNVPERRVNDAWRALLLQNFVLADGARFTYGSGLRYNDNTYPQESNFAAHTFSMFGLKEYGNALQAYFPPMALTPKGAGRKYQNRRAMPFHHLLENWRLTGSTGIFERYRQDLYRVADEIIAQRRSTMREENGRRPLHWGLLPPDKPGVDTQASTQRVYVLGHNVTNCQGLADFGLFLVRTGIDAQRGKLYLREAADFRRTLLAAMERAAIRMPGRPPFLDLQTLYFRETPDHGPEPYDDLALGRLQGAYYHYWLDMELRYRFFDPDDAPARWMADYAHARNGFVLGLTRAAYRQESPFGWVNNVYDGGYYDYRLRQGAVNEFLLGFYSKLAYAISRHLLVQAEGTPFIGYNTRLGGWLDPDLSFPNSAANADLLLMLRDMLVYEDLRANVETGVLHVLRGAPLRWFAPGKRTEAVRLATYFGDISFTAAARPGGHTIAIELSPPRHPLLKTITVWVRAGAPLRSVTVDGRPHPAFDANSGEVRLAAGRSRYSVVASF